MKFIRIASYLFLAATGIVGFLIFFNSDRKILSLNNYQVSRNDDFSILVHPEKYLYFIDTQTQLKQEINGTNATVDASDSWTEFIPQLFLHSAFADEKKNSNVTLIRIIAVGPKIHIYRHNLQCVFQTNQTSWTEPLDDFTIIRHWQFRYFMFQCVSRGSVIPTKVGLIDESTSSHSSLLNIHFNTPKAIPKHTITVCVLPKFEKPDITQLFAEFLSYYDAVGVTSFIFYDYNMTEKTKSFINKVAHLGINITVIPWTIPNATALANRRILQIASVQHCIYRNRGRTKYILPIDINEFLVPRQHFSLTELMNELTTISKQKVGSYIFRLSHFCSKGNITKKREDSSLVTSKDFYREDKILQLKKRSRYAVQPNTVTEGGLYYVRKHLKSWKSAKVPWQLALVHRYYPCSRTENFSKFIEDRTAESFKYEILLSKPMKVFREFKYVPT